MRDDEIVHAPDVCGQVLQRIFGPGFQVGVHVDHVDGFGQAGQLQELGDEAHAPGDAPEDHGGGRIGGPHGAGTGQHELGKLCDSAGPVGGVVGLVPELPGVDAGAVARDQRGDEARERFRVARRRVPVIVAGVAGRPTRGIADIRNEAEVIFIDGHADEIIPEGKVDGVRRGLHFEPAEGNAQGGRAGGSADLQVAPGALQAAGGGRVIFAQADLQRAQGTLRGVPFAQTARGGSGQASQQEVGQNDQREQPRGESGFYGCVNHECHRKRAGIGGRWQRGEANLGTELSSCPLSGVSPLAAPTNSGLRRNRLQGCGGCRLMDGAFHGCTCTFGRCGTFVPTGG